MTISGLVKFLGTNYIDADITLSATSADTDNKEFLYDRSSSSKLQSIGSTDLIPEVWEITFAGTRTFDRLLFSLHNIKLGEVKYWNGTAWASFSTPASWSANSATTSYFEFNSVSTKKIQITMTTTIIVDAEKYITEAFSFLELGTLVKNPKKANPDFPENSKKQKTSQGGTLYTFFGSKFKVKLDILQAPEADFTLYKTLKNRAEPFFVYLCGGQTGYTEYGFRINDIYLVNYVNSLKYKLSSTAHGSGVDIKIELREV